MTCFVIISLLTAVLAAVNGANDVSKGVATLAGSGITRYRAAIFWGAITTLAGAIVSGLVATRMFQLFTSGIVTAPSNSIFAFAVLSGAAGFVGLATLTKLPVSTTHAIIGSLLGAGLFHSPASVAWANLAPKLALPLFLSVGASYSLSAILNWTARARDKGSDCLRIDAEQLDFGVRLSAQITEPEGASQKCSSAGGYLRSTSETLSNDRSPFIGDLLDRTN